jgi:hypothetical protein
VFLVKCALVILVVWLLWKLFGLWSVWSYWHVGSILDDGAVREKIANVQFGGYDGAKIRATDLESGRYVEFRKHIPGDGATSFCLVIPEGCVPPEMIVRCQQLLSAVNIVEEDNEDHWWSDAALVVECGCDVERTHKAYQCVMFGAFGASTASKFRLTRQGNILLLRSCSIGWATDPGDIPRFGENADVKDLPQYGALLERSRTAKAQLLIHVWLPYTRINMTRDATSSSGEASYQLNIWVKSDENAGRVADVIEKAGFVAECTSVSDGMQISINAGPQVVTQLLTDILLSPPMRSQDSPMRIWHHQIRDLPPARLNKLG